MFIETWLKSFCLSCLHSAQPNPPKIHEGWWAYKEVVQGSFVPGKPQTACNTLVLDTSWWTLDALLRQPWDTLPLARICLLLIFLILTGPLYPFCVADDFSRLTDRNLLFPPSFSILSWIDVSGQLFSFFFFGGGWGGADLRCFWQQLQACLRDCVGYAWEGMCGSHANS